MAEISACMPASVEKKRSLPSSQKNSVSDIDVMADAHTQERIDAAVTSVPSAEDSRGLNTPDCDSVEVKMTAASRWATVQEALEACLDPFFLAGQSSVKDDKIVEELTQLLDTSLTAHVPALASLSFLQPLFSGNTRSERLDAVLGAARASNKLVLRDDLPVPSSTGWMLSVDEAEAAGLRLGPRSHAEGINRSVLTLERKHSNVDAEEALRALTLAQLQASVPQHKIVKLERVEAPCALRAVFVTPTAADRAYATWRAHAPHGDIRVLRVGNAGGAPSGKSQPAAPRSAAAVGPAVPAPRTALRCPRVVGEAISRHTSSENVNDACEKSAAAAAAPRVAVPVPKPPPAIDAVLTTGATKSVVAPAVSSDASTTNTTPSPENSTSKSKFNMNATPFLPKSVLNAQLAAAAGVGSAGGAWWPRGTRTRRSPGCEDASTGSMDTSEALANQMLMDSSTGWMYPALDPYSAPAWQNKFAAGVDGWAEGAMGSEMPSLAATAAVRRESPAMPERPKALGADMPVAPCALGDSPCAKALPAVVGLQGRPDLYPPRPVNVSLPSEQPASSSFDNVCPAHTSPLSQSSPANLSTSRRHRHDPYSPTGFVLCAESSCASSLTHPPCHSPAAPHSNKLLFAGSLTSEKMASFCFEDPLIKASARRRERRRQLREEEEGATRLSSSEAGGSSLSNLEGSDSAQADSSSDDVVEQPGEFTSLDEGLVTPAPAAEESVAETNTATAAVEEPVAVEKPVAAAPKSYAEALKLKAKAPAAVSAPASVKTVEAKKEKSAKVAAATTASTRSAAMSEKKSATVTPAKTQAGAAAKATVKPKKVTVAA